MKPNEQQKKGGYAYTLTEKGVYHTNNQQHESWMSKLFLDAILEYLPIYMYKLYVLSSGTWDMVKAAAMLHRICLFIWYK